MFDFHSCQATVKGTGKDGTTELELVSRAQWQLFVRRSS